MENFDNDFIQYSGKKVKEETKHLALYFFVHITLYVVLIFFMIFFAWYTAFTTMHKFYAVKGVSMMSTLNSQITQSQLDNINIDITSANNAQNLSYDGVYIEKNVQTEIFDIVVIEKSDASSVIKRVMAMQGDYITIAKGENENGDECFYFYRIESGADLSNFADESAKVYENGQNGYSIYNSSTLWTHKKSQSSPVTVTVGENVYEYNFYNTFLSSYGTQNEKYDFFVSDAGLVYVKVPEDKVFYMGDNRQYSSDSRENGFCDTSDIVGSADIVVYNYNFVSRLWEVVKFYFKEMETFFAR